MERRYRIPIAVVLLLSSFIVNGVSAESNKKTRKRVARTAIYGEVVGYSFSVLSLNIDHEFAYLEPLRCSFRLGAGVTLVAGPSKSYFVPLSTQFSFFTYSHHPEMGIGISLRAFQKDGAPLDTAVFDEVALPFFYYGYRFQPANGGFMLRFYATHLYVSSKNTFAPSAGISFGAAF